jgi:hypothetical protein
MALEIKNEELFNQIVSDAIQSAITNSSTEQKAKRWERAIDRAVKEIQENPYLHYEVTENHLVILSSSSNKIYAANGDCQCLAFLNGKLPCWHRAAARIWRLYTEAENKPLPPAKAAAAVAAPQSSAQEMESSPYFQKRLVKETPRRKVGRFWV